MKVGVLFWSKRRRQLGRRGITQNVINNGDRIICVMY